MKLLIISALLALATVHAATPQQDAEVARKLFEAQSAATKQDAIWDAITADETSWPWPGLIEQSTILIESMNTTFDTVSDVLPEGRKKLIHSEGYVFKFQFEPSADSPYTGGFAGANYGIGRLSFAVEPSDDGIVPGSAWKFLRDGAPSGDMIAMKTLDILPTFNFFDPVFSNHLVMPSYDGLNGILDKLISYKFETASNCIFALGISNVALFTEDGGYVPNPQSPFQVFLHAQVSMPDDGANLGNWPALFAQFPAGTTLYDVYALEAPDSQPVLIGSITTTSDIVPSNYGDLHLFFEHQRMDGPAGDLARNPQWADQGLDLAKLCHH